MLTLINLLIRLLKENEGKPSTDIQANLGSLQALLTQLVDLFNDAEQALTPEYISSKKQRRFFTHFLQYNHSTLNKAQQTLARLIDNSTASNSINPAKLESLKRIIGELRGRVDEKLNDVNNTASAHGKSSPPVISNFLKQFITCLDAPLKRVTPLIPNNGDERFPAALAALQPKIDAAQKKRQQQGLYTNYSCFLSYAWGNPEHERIVANVAHQLEQAGLHVFFDRLEDVPGKQIQHFVSKINTANWILLFGSQLYKEKYDKRASHQSGREHVVRTEAQIMNTIAMRSVQNQQSIIPILLEGTHETALPQPFYNNPITLDFNKGDYIEHIKHLIATLYHMQPKTTVPARNAAAASSSAADKDDVPEYLLRLLKSDLTPEAFSAALNNLDNTHLSTLLQTQDDAGNTPLHIAIQHQTDSIQNILLHHINSLENAEAYYSQINHTGQTPKDLALVQFSPEPGSSTAHATSQPAQNNMLNTSNSASPPPQSAEVAQSLRVYNFVTCLLQHYQQQTEIQQHTLTLDALKHNYIEQLYSLRISGETPKSMLEYITNWLRTPAPPTLLILGESGSGKTLLTQFWEQHLWQHLKPEWHFVPTELPINDYVRTHNLTSAVLYHQQQWWLYFQEEQNVEQVKISDLTAYPFMSPLQKHTYQSLQMAPKLRELLCHQIHCYWLCQQKSFVPIRIPLGDYDANNVLHCVVTHLQAIFGEKFLKFEQSDLLALKKAVRFLCLFDAYDEIKCAEGQFNKNLYRSNGLNKWSAKALFTCHSQYFDSARMKNRCFNSVNTEPATQIYSTQFKPTDINAYIEQYTKTHDLPNARQIITELNEQPKLAELLATPLLLNLYLKSHRLDEGHPKNHWELYQRLLQRLFERQADKYFVAHPTCALRLEDLARRYETLSAELAFELLTQNKDVLAREGERYPQASSSQQADPHLASFFSGKDSAQEALHRSHPFKCTPGGHYGYIHESFKAFFIAKHLLADLEQAAHHSPPQAAQTWNTILLPEKPVIFRFLKEAISTETHAQATSLLNEWIRLKEPKNARVSANAASLLAQLGQSFSNQDLSGTYLMGANLSGGMFDSTNFTGADCSGINFSQAWLRNANFTRADLSDTEWGEYPKLELRGKVRAMYSDATGITQIATTDGNKIYLWNGVTGEKLATLKGHTGDILCLSYSRDGAQLASGSLESTIRLWNLARRCEEASLSGHTGRVLCLSYSRDGAQLASGSSDCTIRLWNLAQRCEEASLREHSASVSCLSYSRDGAQLASGSDDRTIRLWNLARRCEVASLSGHSGRVLCLSYSRDGAQLASGSEDRTIRLWNLARRCEVASLSGHTSWVLCLSYNQDGAQLASGSSDRTIRLWNLARRCEVASLSGHTDDINCLNYSRDGAQLASGSHDSTMRLWNLARRCQEASLSGHSGIVWCLSYSRDGAQLASGSHDSTIRLWNLARRCEVASLSGHTDWIRCLGYSRDGAQLASGSYDSTIRLWNLARRCEVASLRGHSGSVWCLSYSRDGAQLASGSYDSTIRLWNLAQRCEVASLSGHTGSVWCLSYSRDGAQLASGSDDCTIRLWNLARRCEVASLSGHTGKVFCLSYSRDGAQLASGSSDSTVRLWNLARRCEVASLSGHSGRVWCLSYSRDGAQLASSSSDKTLRIWDHKNHNCLRILSLHLPIYALAWHGKFLAIGCHSEIVHLQTPQSSKPEDWCATWRAARNPALCCNDLLLSGSIRSPITTRLLLQHGAVEVSDNSVIAATPEASSSTAAPNPNTLFSSGTNNQDSSPKKEKSPRCILS
jgi:WD40 repeat protein